MQPTVIIVIVYKANVMKTFLISLFPGITCMATKIRIVKGKKVKLDPL